MKTKVISMVNIKGGVGKTISSVNIATILANKGNKTLLIDIDPQSNSTKYLNRYSSTEPSVYEVLMDKSVAAKDVIIKTDIENLDLLPSNIKMIKAESEILTDLTRSRENRLIRAVENLDYDYIVIDCPPALGMVTTNSLVASEFVLVPIKIDEFALDGFSYLLSTIDETKEEFNSKLKFLGAFLTFDDNTNLNKQGKQSLKDSLGNNAFDISIRRNTKVSESTFARMPVVLYDANAIASIDYLNLTDEILNKINNN